MERVSFSGSDSTDERRPGRCKNRVRAVSDGSRKGARQVVAACTHAVLSGAAVEKVNASVLEELIVTNTIPFDSKKEECKKLTVLSIAPLLGEAIKRIHEESSISSLFV